MIQYTWCVRGLTTEPSYDGLEDYVNAAQWQLTATDDVTLQSAWTADTWQTLTPDPTQPYVARSELTDDLVVGWIQTALGPEQVSAIEAETASRIPPGKPAIGLFEVLEGPVHEWDNGIVKDVWTVRPMTDEEKAAKIAEYQAMPPPFPNWTLNLDTLVWEAPVPKPTEGGPYLWDVDTNNWISLTPPEAPPT